MGSHSLVGVLVGSEKPRAEGDACFNLGASEAATELSQAPRFQLVILGAWGLRLPDLCCVREEGICVHKKMLTTPADYSSRSRSGFGSHHEFCT